MKQGGYAIIAVVILSSILALFATQLIDQSETNEMLSRNLESRWQRQNLQQLALNQAKRAVSQLSQVQISELQQQDRKSCHDIHLPKHQVIYCLHVLAVSQQQNLAQITIDIDQRDSISLPMIL